MNRIFIVGSPRSGTTLVQSIVAAHPSAISFTESHFFESYQALPFGGYRTNKQNLRKRFVKFLEENTISVPRESTESMLGVRDPEMQGKWFFELLDRCAHAKEKDMWIEKTPGHVNHIEQILRISPDARFVHVIRKPLPTIISMRDASAQWQGVRQWSWMKCYVKWKHDTHVSVSYARNPRHYIVFYEDIIDATEREAASLLEWLGLAPDPDILSRRTAAAQSIINNGETWKANTFKAIQAIPEDESKAPFYIHWLTRMDALYDKLRFMKQSEQRSASTVSG